MTSRETARGRSLRRRTTVLIPLSLALFARAGLAVDRTWDGGGGDNNWSTAANWTSDTAPGTLDRAVFNGTSTKSATIDVPIDVAGILISTGYTGTITQGAGASVTVGSSGYSQADGTFLGGSAGLTFTDVFNQSGGAFTAGSGTMDVNYTFALSGNATFTATSGTFFVAYTFSRISTATFNHNGGTVVFDTAFGSSVFVPDTSAFTTFQNVTVSKNGGSGIFLGDDGLIVVGALLLNDGNISSGTVVPRRASPFPPPSTAERDRCGSPAGRIRPSRTTEASSQPKP